MGNAKERDQYEEARAEWAAARESVRQAKAAITTARKEEQKRRKAYEKAEEALAVVTSL